MRETKWFATPNEASAFIAGKSDADVWPSSGGWSVAWDEPEPPSAFERIVSRNGGEPAPDATYTGGKTIKDSFLDHRGDALAYSQFDTAKHTVDAPAEIVQRHRVTGITESVDGPAPSDEAFSVSLRAMSGPYGVHESRFFAMSKEEAQQFKVGSEIEVVLRPAPLA